MTSPPLSFRRKPGSTQRVEASTIVAIVVFSGFMLWLYSSEEAAKKKREQQERDSERREYERQLRNAKLSTEQWRKSEVRSSNKSNSSNSN